jgi:hypothetical protein
MTSPVEPSLTREEAENLVAAKTAPKVTKESIEAKIAHVEHTRPFFENPTMTVCAITMRNGFTVTGISAPASPENFDEQVGQRYAYDDAFKKLWQLEGYLLRSRLAGEIPALTDAAPSNEGG